MRVVYVSSCRHGGTVTHLHTLAPTVADAGADVLVICATEEIAARFRRDGVEATVLELRHKFDVANAARLRRFLRSADVVHTHDRRASLYARPLARALGARAVATYHGLPDELASRVDGSSYVPPGTSLWRRLVARSYLPLEAALAALGQVVVPSRALAQYLVEHGFQRDRVHVIPSGIDIRRTEPARPHDPFVVCTSAYLIPRKGVDVLIAAAAKVKRPIRLEIFGDGDLRGELERQAASLGVDARFRGDVPDVRNRLEDVDLFVLPTRGDNLPVAILEAMACALPVVGTRVGGVPELVAHGETGIVVEPDSPDAMARAIDEIAGDTALRERYARGGAQRAARLFEAGVVARQMVRLYEELNGN